MCYELALDRALEDIQGIDPAVVAARTGAVCEEGRLRLAFFDRTFFVHYTVGRVEEAGASGSPPDWLSVLLLRYLLLSKGGDLAGEWIAYRQLPGGLLIGQKFVSMAINPLIAAFGQDGDYFAEAALSLGGEPIPGSGDAAFRFLALPRVPLGCILYLGEDEMPPSVNILFDASAPRYLPTEDLCLVGSYFTSALTRGG